MFKKFGKVLMNLEENKLGDKIFKNFCESLRKCQKNLK